MASTVALPLGNYANQTRVVGPFNVADGVTSMDFSIARCTSADLTIWPNASTTLSVKPEVSCDGEVTWIECGAFTSAGGIATGKNGQEAPFTIGGGSLPPPVNGVTRRGRFTITIAGGPLRSSATAELN